MTGRPSSQELADRAREGYLVASFDGLTGDQQRVAQEGYESVLALAARLQAAEQALEDIATRQWRDEGGRIAAAIARDGLSALRALEGAAE